MSAITGDSSDIDHQLPARTSLSRERAYPSNGAGTGSDKTASSPTSSRSWRRLRSLSRRISTPIFPEAWMRRTNALGAKADTVYFKTNFDLIAHHTIAVGMRLDEAAVKTQIEDSPPLQIPTLNAELDWAPAAKALNFRRSFPSRFTGSIIRTTLPSSLSIGGGPRWREDPHLRPNPLIKTGRARSGSGLFVQAIGAPGVDSSYEDRQLFLIGRSGLSAMAALTR